MKIFKSFAEKCLHFLLPPLCYNCNKPLVDAQKLCGTCWSKLNFITKPYCIVCGLPFAFDMGENPKCLSCIQHNHNFDLLRSVFTYDDLAKKLIMRFKHGDRTELLPLFIHTMKPILSELGKIDLILPVPLHWRRLLKRKYNQAALIAQKLGKESHIESDMFALKRKKSTQMQHGGKIERAKNIEASFTILEKSLPKIEQKTILLIDDVVTTGATIQECAKTLKEANAKKVYVLTLARVNLPL